MTTVLIVSTIIGKTTYHHRRSWDYNSLNCRSIQEEMHHFPNYIYLSFNSSSTLRTIKKFPTKIWLCSASLISEANLQTIHISDRNPPIGMMRNICKHACCIEEEFKSRCIRDTTTLSYKMSWSAQLNTENLIDKYSANL